MFPPMRPPDIRFPLPNPDRSSMSTSRSERRHNTARKLTISVAALLVTVLPTACGYAYAAPPSTTSGVSAAATSGSGHSGHSSEGGQEKPTDNGDANQPDRGPAGASGDN